MLKEMDYFSMLFSLLGAPVKFLCFGINAALLEAETQKKLLQINRICGIKYRCFGAFVANTSVSLSEAYAHLQKLLKNTKIGNN